MFSRPTTLVMFQPPRDWLKLSAALTSPAISVRLRVSQPEMSALKALAMLNMFRMVVTFRVSQVNAEMPPLLKL